MNIQILLPLVVTLLAGVLYWIAKHPRGLELARLTFQAAALVLLAVLAQASVRVLVEK